MLVCGNVLLDCVLDVLILSEFIGLYGVGGKVECCSFGGGSF